MINEKLNDDTGRQVEKAIKTVGGKISCSGKKGKGCTIISHTMKFCISVISNQNFI